MPAPKPLELKLDILSSFPFPTSVQQTLQEMVSSSENTEPAIIQRVSEKSFVIRTPEKSFQTPLKLLHIRFDSQNKFHCQCSQFKKTQQLSSAPTAPKLSKRCIHLYICMWAFLSCPSLQQEFSMYVHLLQQGMQSIVAKVFGNTDCINSYAIFIYFYNYNYVIKDMYSQFQPKQLS